MRQRSNTRLALVASAGLLAGSLATVVGTTAPAQAAPDVTINLVGINDFHGRIDANTVKWAGTVKKLEKSTPGVDPNNSLVVGAGDLIGASVFASAVANDQPTIDVMNEIDVDASAVGNHEFDKGWADLRDRVIGPSGSHNATWDYLGANVYQKGTTTPVLPEYATYTVGGVKVGVIGAVTQETPSLVSPGGITDLDFGDPVAAVNRVAAQLSDGNAANGEADVLVATFHAGSNVTTSYQDALASGGAEFANMANLNPNIDAIFNGHTHQKYVFNQPVTGGDRPTRPIVQTGQYGENVGQILLDLRHRHRQGDRQLGEQHRPGDHQRRRPDHPRTRSCSRSRTPSTRPWPTPRSRVTSRSARSPATSRRRSPAAPSSTASTPAVPGTTGDLSRRSATWSPTRCATGSPPPRARPTSGS